MADANMNYLYTIGGYATLFGVGYAIYHVSTQKNQKRAVAAANARTAKSSYVEPKKETKKKKQRMESFTSEAQGSNEKQSQATKSESPATETPAPSSSSATKDDVDNLQFAKQLSKAKQGKQFSGSAESGKKHKEKSVKQSHANKIGAPAEEKPIIQPEPLTNGAEVEDEESPEQSPVAEPADASGVADMLEPVASPGPSVLRLTDTESKNKKKKSAKAPEPVETKKQRQNRKKAEAARAAREEAEQERRGLEEKQRRAARIAEGRSAKDGSQYTNAASAKSAWAQGAPSKQSSTEAKSPELNGSYQLLDTFDESATKDVQSSKTQTPWISSLPSEEEQIEMLKDEADEWSTVKTKSSKKSKKDTSGGSGDDAPSQPAVQPKQLTSTGSSGAAKSSQSFGSFSALTTKDEPTEEIEEEWEV